MKKSIHQNFEDLKHGFALTNLGKQTDIVIYHLHLNNYWKYKAKTLIEDELAKELQTYFEDRNPLSKDFTFYSDLLNNCLKVINWREVAKKLIPRAEIPDPI